MATLRTHVRNLEFAFLGTFMRAFLCGLIVALISFSTVVMAADSDDIVDVLWGTKPNQTGLSTELRCASDGACVVSSSVLFEFDYVVSGKQIRGVMTDAGSANGRARDFDLIFDASPDNPTEALLKFTMWASEPVVLKRFTGSALQTHSLTGEWIGHVQPNAANAAVSPMATRANALHLQLGLDGKARLSLKLADIMRARLERDETGRLMLVNLVKGGMRQPVTIAGQELQLMDNTGRVRRFTRLQFASETPGR